MQSKATIWLLTIILMVAIMTAVQAQEWSINANYTESCNCNPACPCVFGSPSTLGYCFGNGLMEIKEANYDGVKLDGLSIAVAFKMGEWEKYYISKTATDEQVKAGEKLVEAFFKMPNSKILSFEKGTITVERSGDKIKFETADSEVEIELMKGTDDKPIKIENLPDYDDYTQYKAITNQHSSENKDMEFSYSGTNALTSTKVGSSNKK